MSDQRKPPGKVPPKALLDELSSIRSLLGDADKDVPPMLLEGEELPVLTPDAPGGDAHTQASLFDAPAPGGRDPLRKALAERENPFLPRKPAAPAAAAPTLKPTRPAPAASPSAPARRPDDAAVRALVDELVAAWLPKIEQELRDRLTAMLRNTP